MTTNDKDPIRTDTTAMILTAVSLRWLQDFFHSSSSADREEE